MEKKEMKIGEVLPFGFKKIRCVENEATGLCKGCLFERFGNYCQTYIKVLGNCMERSDGKSVIFVIEEE